MALRLILIGAAILTTTIATIVGLNRNAIVLALKGKRVVVLGGIAVGKTNLTKFLSSGSVPEEYTGTVDPVKEKSRRFELNGLSLNIKEGYDVGGLEKDIAVWKELCDHADIVFYLLRADLLLAGDGAAEERVRRDIRHIGIWLEAREKNRPSLFIIGTHCDLDPAFIECCQQKKPNEYKNKFVSLPVMTELIAIAGGLSQVKVVLGSTKTVEDIERVVFSVFDQVES
ncbi:MAG: GTPase domain-containing protein [Polyangiaceae bacterium]|nr:GTPase domain-containing protein [Polyangiaceae bacterium]